MDPVPPLRTVRAAVPEGVERSVMRALAKVPADRFPTAAAFAEALASAPREATVVSSPTPVVPGRRRIAALAAAGLALVIVLGGIPAVASLARRARPRPGRRRPLPRGRRGPGGRATCAKG